MRSFLRKLINNFYNLVDSSNRINANIQFILNDQNHLKELEIDNYLQLNLYNNPRYQDDKKLNNYEFKVFSQGGEDGIISEIFQRIGTTNKFFVEFGVGNGLENNSAYLLTKGWSGYWIEGSKNYCFNINKKFEDLIGRGQLTLKNAFINAENIEELLRAGNVPIEPDLLSIDIDGNDYWVWKAIVNYRPRVVIVEYNAIYPPECAWVMEYNPDHVWQYDSYMGSSLKALEKLADSKGYKLVGCSFSGVNAFFVREDLVGDDRFLPPYTAENHYERARYFLCTHKNGHNRAFGKFRIIE